VACLNHLKIVLDIPVYYGIMGTSHGARASQHKPRRNKMTEKKTIQKEHLEVMTEIKNSVWSIHRELEELAERTEKLWMDSFSSEQDARMEEARQAVAEAKEDRAKKN
jgi:hypothetical protein